MKRLLFVVNDAAFFLSHRLPIARGAQECGYQVHVATPEGPATADVLSEGIRHHPVPLSRSGTNPFEELRSLWLIHRLFRSLRPDIVHLVTTKPILYGGLAARWAGVPAVLLAVPGLGFPFSDLGLKARVLRVTMKLLYRAVLGHRNLRAIVQNDHDRITLQRLGGAAPDRIALIPGSGVDLSRFRVTPEPIGVPVVTLAARLLRSKGVLEFVEAARQLRGRGVDVRFWLVGAPDPGNLASISADELEALREEGAVEVLGSREDIPDVFAASNMVVLPSYYGEGLPKVLIEAAASGRAVVTTDHPGCRDAILPGVTGVLVPPRDAGALGSAIQGLLGDPERRSGMGIAGRRLAEERFRVEAVVDAHLTVYRLLEPVSEPSA